MPRYEYKVVPAPKKPGKIKGVKGTGNKFAVELATLMNKFGAEGWEYQRTDTLPCEERQGLTGRTTTFQNMLVFRRDIVAEEPAELPTETPKVEAEPMLAVPTFRSSAAAAAAPALAAAIADVPEGAAPEIGTATAPEPERVPGIAAQ